MICSDKGNMKNRLLSKCFLTILIIAVSVFFVTSQGAADPIFKIAGDLKASKIKKFKFPVVTVNVPIQISNLAMHWRGADLVVEAAVFFHGPGYWEDNIKGVAYGQTIKSNALTNGSSQGMVHVNIYEVMGVTTGQYATISIVVARLGDQCKVLGFGHNFNGGCPQDLKEDMDKAMDQVIPWSDPIMQSPGLKAVMNY